MKAIVLAGKRAEDGPDGGVGELRPTVMTPVAGRPSLVRVVGALRSAKTIDGGLLAGPEMRPAGRDGVLADLLAADDFAWMAPAAGPAESVLEAVGRLNAWPVLVTTGDHALLSAKTIDGFCAAAGALDADLAVGLAPYRLVAERFPSLRRTRLRFTDGTFCGTNLFYLGNPKAVQAIAFWANVQRHRKRPWRIVRRLGWRALASYIFGRLSLDAALGALSRLTDCAIGWVGIEDPQAAVDVDTTEDLAVAERILRCRSRSC